MSKEKKETKDNQNFDIYKVIKDLEEFFGGNTNAAVRVVNDAAIEVAYKRGYEARKQEANKKDRDYAVNKVKDLVNEFGLDKINEILDSIKMV